MKKFKGYREQALECDVNGNRFLVDISLFTSRKPDKVLICGKYKTYCHSKACLKERLKDE